MGFSVGGEYIAVVAYLLEGAPRNRRGLITSLASASSEVGGLLAVGVSLTHRQFDELGQLLGTHGDGVSLFSVGAVLAASVWIARTTMEKSPDFRKAEGKRHGARTPVALRAGRLRPAILRSFAISALGSITYYVGITYVPTFLTSAGKLTESNSLRLSTAAAVAVILVSRLPTLYLTGLAGNPS